jgi:hypothetical protein
MNITVNFASGVLFLLQNGSDFIDDPTTLLDGGVLLRSEHKLMIWNYVTGID